MNSKSSLIAAIILICSALGFTVVVSQTPPQTPAPLRSELPLTSSTTTIQVPAQIGPKDIYPDSGVTPGARNLDVTQDTISQNICNPQWSTKSIRPAASYTTGLKKQQLAGDYAYENISDTKLVEEDHLISLELGGNPTDPRNLWPEPYTASIPDGGAKVKDTVENYLHKKVCAGALSLSDAQYEISTDWYAVYKMMNGAGPVTGSVDENDQ